MGNGNRKNRDRESRDHYGKGKGKMFEEANSKWVKVPEKGSKRTSTYRGNYRGDGENSYRRPVRREEMRVGGQENQNHISSGRARVQEAQNETREEVCEDGEIKHAEEGLTITPSPELQEALTKTQAAGIEEISDPTEEEEGLQKIQGLLGNHVDDKEDGEVMEMDEIKAVFLEHGIDMDAADDLPDCSEEEAEGMLMGQEEEEASAHEGEAQVLVEADKDATAEELAKKHGTPKPGIRHGENSKQLESKGPSNLKSGHQKDKINVILSYNVMALQWKIIGMLSCCYWRSLGLYISYGFAIECRRGHDTSLLILFTEPHGSELTDKGWVWLQGKIVIGHGKMCGLGLRLAQSRFDWHQESYKGGISLNGVSLNTFTCLVVRRYQRENLQTFEEAGKVAQLILLGNGGFEACGLGLLLSWSLRGDLPARILREKIVGISSEYRYSDDIPTKQVVGNNSSEFLLSSEIPRNFPTEFRGNKFPRKFRGPFVCRKCPRNIPRENIVGIFPRTFIDRCVLDIYTSIDRNIPTKIFLGIFRGTCPSVYSEELVPRNIPREQFLGIF
ncbi:hypothetical protein F2Q70_00016285 [Brassica cretica]|uniref:Uncharacterized protein n=1 Tax=Brassica cretica TaxID=69181 RepID=A0A8S9I1G4_BRACR|nr:hypothetical protein F2Q70_00016285 [Brassica cretica]